MKTLEDVLVELRVERTELLSWVEASWVRPDPDAAGPRFHPVDVARRTMGVTGVRSCRNVRSRGMEESVYVDLKIEVDPLLSTAQAHEVADQVETLLQEAYPQVVDVVVHVEPASATPSRA